MPDFYISRLGAGSKDGTLGNAKDHASVINSDYNGVVAGSEFVYVLDTLDAMFIIPTNLNGTAGNVQEIIAHNGGSTTTGEAAAQFGTGTEYIRLQGGLWNVKSGARGIQLFHSKFCEVNNATIIVESVGQIAFYHWMDAAHVAEGVALTDSTIFVHEDQGDAIVFAMSNTAGHSAYYLNCIVANNYIYNGKLIALVPTDHIHQMIRVNGRNSAGWLIKGNNFVETERNAIQVGFTAVSPESIIRDNYLVDCGRGPHGTTNVIQTNWNLGLVIEDNVIDNPQNPGGSGDGAGIMPDWTAVGSDYSEDMVVQRNAIDSADEVGVTAPAGIHNWAANNTKIQCNQVTNSTNGLVLSEAISQKDGTVTGITTTDPTVLTYTSEAGNHPADYFSYRTGDIAHVTLTGNAPPVDGIYTLTYVSEDEVSIEVATTSAGSAGTIVATHRTESCEMFCNTLVANERGLWSKTGARNGKAYGNIITEGIDGVAWDDNTGSHPLDEKYNCFYNNTGDDIDYDGTPGVIDSTSIIADPKFVDELGGDYNLQSDSPCVGSQMPKWWGQGPRPVSLSGEPIPDVFIDMGAYQSTHHPGHPQNLGTSPTPVPEFVIWRNELGVHMGWVSWGGQPEFLSDYNMNLHVLPDYLQYKINSGRWPEGTVSNYYEGEHPGNFDYDPIGDVDAGHQTEITSNNSKISSFGSFSIGDMVDFFNAQPTNQDIWWSLNIFTTSKIRDISGAIPSNHRVNVELSNEAFVTTYQNIVADFTEYKTLALAGKAEWVKDRPNDLFGCVLSSREFDPWSGGAPQIWDDDVVADARDWFDAFIIHPYTYIDYNVYTDPEDMYLQGIAYFDANWQPTYDYWVSVDSTKDIWITEYGLLVLNDPWVGGGGGGPAGQTAWRNSEYIEYFFANAVLTFMANPKVTAAHAHAYGNAKALSPTNSPFWDVFDKLNNIPGTVQTLVNDSDEHIVMIGDKIANLQKTAPYSFTVT